MTDIFIRDIDTLTLERLNAVAVEQGCTKNDIALRALRFALGLSSKGVLGQDRQDIATMRGIWNQGENQAFSEAMDAFQRIESGPLFEPRDKE
jgi:hypothetical protein